MLHNQHQDLAQGKWLTMTLAEQLGNIGSDFDRALRWKEKNQPQLFMNALVRTLELLDLTLSNSDLASHRRKEVARLREEVCKELFSDKINPKSSQQLQRYFLSMATLARR